MLFLSCQKQIIERIFFKSNLLLKLTLYILFLLQKNENYILISTGTRFLIELVSSKAVILPRYISSCAK